MSSIALPPSLPSQSFGRRSKLSWPEASRPTGDEAAVPLRRSLLERLSDCLLQSRIDWATGGHAADVKDREAR
jgi:hypothetical protein